MKLKVYVGGFEEITLEGLVDILIGIDTDWHQEMMGMYAVGVLVGAAVISQEELPRQYNPNFFTTVFETTSDELNGLITQYQKIRNPE